MNRTRDGTGMVMTDDAKRAKIENKMQGTMATEAKKSRAVVAGSVVF